LPQKTQNGSVLFRRQPFKMEVVYWRMHLNQSTSSRNK